MKNALNKEEFLMKRKFVSVILTAAVVAGTFSAATVEVRIPEKEK